MLNIGIEDRVTEGVIFEIRVTKFALVRVKPYSSAHQFVSPDKPLVLKVTSNGSYLGAEDGLNQFDNASGFGPTNWFSYHTSPYTPNVHIGRAGKVTTGNRYCINGQEVSEEKFKRRAGFPF